MLSGPRLLSDGMEQLAWAGGWHVTRFLYSRDTNLHLPMVLAMLVSAGELCLFSRQLCLFSRQLCLFSQQLCLFSRKACRRQRLWFGDLASIIASSMLTIVLIDNERGGLCGPVDIEGLLHLRKDDSNLHRAVVQVFSSVRCAA